MGKENKETVTVDETVIATKKEVDIQALIKAEVEKMREEVRAEIQTEMGKVSVKEQAEQMGAERQVKKLVQSMKSKLDRQPKVKIKIPIDKNNEKDLTCFAQINGYTFTMKRGEEIEVPIAVKKLLERAGTI